MDVDNLVTPRHDLARQQPWVTWPARPAAACPASRSYNQERPIPVAAIRSATGPFGRERQGTAAPATDGLGVGAAAALVLPSDHGQLLSGWLSAGPEQCAAQLPTPRVRTVARSGGRWPTTLPGQSTGRRYGTSILLIEDGGGQRLRTPSPSSLRSR